MKKQKKHQPGRPRWLRRQAARPGPRITVHINAGPAPLGALDMTRPGDEQAKVTAGAGFVVRVQVGDGLQYDDLPRTIALARQVRHVRAIEVHGASPDAVQGARKVFTAVFALLDEQDRSGASEDDMRGKWAALALALALARMDRE